ncbi:MAG: hypothetical protein ACRYGL_03190 [Janthinobacterium lividum]
MSLQIRSLGPNPDAASLPVVPGGAQPSFVGASKAVSTSATFILPKDMQMSLWARVKGWFQDGGKQYDALEKHVAFLNKSDTELGPNAHAMRCEAFTALRDLVPRDKQDRFRIELSEAVPAEVPGGLAPPTLSYQLKVDGQTLLSSHLADGDLQQCADMRALVENTGIAVDGDAAFGDFQDSVMLRSVATTLRSHGMEEGAERVLAQKDALKALNSPDAKRDNGHVAEALKMQQLSQSSHGTPFRFNVVVADNARDYRMRLDVDGEPGESMTLFTGTLAHSQHDQFFGMATAAVAIMAMQRMPTEDRMADRREMFGSDTARQMSSDPHVRKFFGNPDYNSDNFHHIEEVEGEPAFLVHFQAPDGVQVDEGQGRLLPPLKLSDLPAGKDGRLSGAALKEALARQSYGSLRELAEQRHMTEHDAGFRAVMEPVRNEVYRLADAIGHGAGLIRLRDDLGKQSIGNTTLRALFDWPEPGVINVLPHGPARFA